MEPVIMIPARMASQRLEKKPLQLIHGDPMIVHAWRRAKEADVGEVVVACDDKRILQAIEAVGGRAILTDPNYPSGSDRIWAALQEIDPDSRYDVVVNLQGDLPDVSPKLLKEVLKPLQDSQVDIATLGVLFENEEDRKDPNQVKIILSRHGESSGRALYFTRADAPHGAEEAFYHIGIYAYRRSVLAKYISLPVSPLERAERLEQLRALEAGMRIDVSIVNEKPVGVDTPADLERARLSLTPQKVQS